jgi:hypothetical protein
VLENVVHDFGQGRGQDVDALALAVPRIHPLPRALQQICPNAVQASRRAAARLAHRRLHLPLGQRAVEGAGRVQPAQGQPFAARLCRQLLRQLARVSGARLGQRAAVLTSQ